MSHVISRLYHLVGVLTQAQKRDFKKYTQFWDYKGSRKYLQLFDITNRFIRSGKEIDAMMKHLSKTDGFEQPAALASMARYLRSKILESVRANQEVSPMTNRLLNMLQDINFLYYKGLFEECEDILRDAKKLATALDKSTYLLEISIWERRLYGVGTVKEESKKIRKIVEEEREIVRNLQKFLDFNTLSHDIFLSLKEGTPLSRYAQESVASLTQRDEEELLKQLPPRAKYWYFNSLHRYYEYLHKQQQAGKKGRDNMANLRLALACLEKSISLSENEGRHVAREEPSMYNALIDNYMNLCLRLGEFKRLDRFEKTILESKNEIQFFRSAVFYRLLHLIRKNKFHDAKKYIGDIDLFNVLHTYGHRIIESRLQLLRYHSGLVNFILEDFQSASDWQNLILNGPRSAYNPTLLLAAELQQTISLYELGMLGKNPIRPLINLQGKLRRRKIQNEFYHQLFLALRDGFEPKLPIIKEERDEQNMLLRTMMKANKTFETYFGPVVAWLEARTNGTTIAAEIIKYQ